MSEEISDIGSLLIRFGIAMEKLRHVHKRHKDRFEKFAELIDEIKRHNALLEQTERMNPENWQHGLDIFTRASDEFAKATEPYLSVLDGILDRFEKGMDEHIRGR